MIIRQMHDSKIIFILALFGWFSWFVLVSETYGDIMIDETASTLSATSSNNIGVGTTALGNITSGEDNIAIGDNSSNALQTGSQNITFGDIHDTNGEILKFKAK